MKKYLLILIFLLSYSLNFAQYFSEYVNEKGFEHSSLFFKSHFLNTFGLYRFSEVAVGLIDDPFLNIYLNPANFSDSLNSNVLLYLDFRGDRIEPSIVAIPERDAIYSGRIAYYPTDPRWYSLTRKEPEPIFSFGILGYPFGKKFKNIFLGGTYQLIHKQERFYSVPSLIYAAEKSAIVAEEGRTNIPIIDRSYGKDQMLHSGHLFSTFLGYSISDKLNLAISSNGVVSLRDGIYISSQNNGRIIDYESKYYNNQERKQDYEHLDFSGGLQFYFTPDFYSGVKVGYLFGNAKQNYSIVDSSLYKYDAVSNNKWNYYKRGSTNQTWNRDGNTLYGGINFSMNLESGKKVVGYYRYTQNDVDLKNTSSVVDTSYNFSTGTNYDDKPYQYRYGYSIYDNRTGKGNRKEIVHETMFNFKWQLGSSVVSAGVYVSLNEMEVNSSEPVIAKHLLDYYNIYNKDTTSKYILLSEKKQLKWKYESSNWSIHIPILLKVQLTKNWSAMFGVNRILNSWNIKEQTIAYFDKREKTEDGKYKVDTNFAERYTEPEQKITEDYTGLIGSFEVTVSQQFKIRLLFDPGFVYQFRIPQWWLSFQASF
jgi:hypothetical protein